MAVLVLGTIPAGLLGLLLQDSLAEELIDPIAHVGFGLIPQKTEGAEPVMAALANVFRVFSTEYADDMAHAKTLLHAGDAG